ncbi:conserved Plasmodium protein, unknown function [Plasmodium knowlesi strain H]|uniref:Uncharacterized protein n=3 Tax=Plasmodium knowlesi TaxID=5850 RepID=A0A1A7VTK0_PLAKH|nr:conserved Plasmodium protein, unknown function [Plasmodium knowlesi strain H]OTN68716.1 Uncharacterized protein PKNOH_S01021200 [Plasmodium knowlesi]CAA9986209.1 conserved Plasmodium protein, unknown function [Plasmodium knowlesi strain H]SBO25414.1 conserved Plasmodium protein, unknown function [Plasmodium knowlesi strain H]SBO27701.1 conserved Plasmodium protein, unknown function [Plasmodium knowlesi strain H]VVS75683.1 conserved Plasmodium protein, unknown function [Plasmodium knowlesi s
MKKKKKLRRNARKITDHLKKIEQECSQLSKHIRKVEEESRSFVITTALLKKYHSYVDSNLMNNEVSIFSSSSFFLNSCGIVFSWKTILEEPKNATQDGCYSGYVESRHSDCTFGGSHMTVHRTLHGTSKFLWREAEVSFSDVCSSPGSISPVGSNPISGKKPKCGRINFPRGGRSWSDCSGDTAGDDNGELWGAEGERGKVFPGKISQLLGQKMGRKERSHEKKKCAIKSNRSYYSGERENPYTNGMLDFSEEGTSENSKRDERSVANQLNEFTIAPKNEDKRKCEKSAAFSPLNMSEGEPMAHVGADSGNRNEDNENDEKEGHDDKISTDSYISMISKGNVFSFFTNKNENKYNPFCHFVNNVKRIFFLSEKEENQNGRCTGEKEKKELMNSLRFKCLVKFKKIIMYACVCPHCGKHFYLLLKKSGRKKIMPRVLSPSHFFSIITLLREQWKDAVEGGINTGDNDIPHLDIAHLDTHLIEYFSDSVMTHHEIGKNSDEHFCNCYVGMDEGGGSLFGDANVLAYL